VPVQIVNLPSPYGDCEPSEDYMQSKCLAECEGNYVISKCSCKLVHMPGSPSTLSIQLAIYHCVPLCAWHSTDVPVWQPATDIRDRRSSLSPLCWHHDTTSAVDSSSYPRRPRLSGGCSACMEQSVTRLGPAFHFWHSAGRPSLTFFVSHTADVAPSTPMASRRLHWAVQQF